MQKHTNRIAHCPIHTTIYDKVHIQLYINVKCGSINLSYTVGSPHEFLVLYYCHTRHEVKDYSYRRQTCRKRDMKHCVGRYDISRFHAKHHIPRQQQKEVAQTHAALQHAVVVEKYCHKAQHATYQEQSEQPAHGIVGTAAEHHHEVVHFEAYAHCLRFEAAERKAQAHH